MRLFCYYEICLGKKDFMDGGRNRVVEEEIGVGGLRTGFGMFFRNYMIRRNWEKDFRVRRREG